MISETHLLAAALGGYGFWAAKFCVFKLKSFSQLPPPLPTRKSTEIVQQSQTAIHPQLYSTLPMPSHFKPVAAQKVPHFHKPDLKCVTLPKAIDLFIDWCNGQGLVGVHAASEIETYWSTACVELDLEPINIKLIWEALDGRGLRLGQKRLNQPEYIAIRQRTGKERLVLFRVPRSRSIAGQAPEGPATPPDLPATTRQRSGTLPATTEKPSQVRRAA